MQRLLVMGKREKCIRICARFDRSVDSFIGAIQATIIIIVVVIISACVHGAV